MERRDFIKWGLVGLAAVTLPVSMGKELSHERQSLFILTHDSGVSSRVAKWDGEKLLVSFDNGNKTHEIKRLFMDGPTTAKPGQYRYCITTPCSPIKPLCEYPANKLARWERCTMLDFKPGVSYREVRSRIVEVLREHRNYS